MLQLGRVASSCVVGEMRSGKALVVSITLPSPGAAHRPPGAPRLSAPLCAVADVGIMRAVFAGRTAGVRLGAGFQKSTMLVSVGVIPSGMACLSEDQCCGHPRGT